MRWRLAPDAREVGFVWRDPRVVEWSTPRLQACVQALVDLTEALDAKPPDPGAARQA